MLISLNVCATSLRSVKAKRRCMWTPRKSVLAGGEGWGVIGGQLDGRPFIDGALCPSAGWNQSACTLANSRSGYVTLSCPVAPNTFCLLWELCGWREQLELAQICKHFCLSRQTLLAREKRTVLWSLCAQGLPLDGSIYLWGHVNTSPSTPPGRIWVMAD